MELDWIWKSVLLALVGMVLLRLAGRKSISQMTVATTVIMISIGTTIVQPIANHELWKAIGSATLFIICLIILEYLQVKWDGLERVMSGRALPIIQNGQLLTGNLRKMRLTVDHLEVRLRQLGIKNIADVKTATLETNGQIGYELMEHARPVTIGDLERILGIQPGMSLETSVLFQEVRQNHHPTPIDPKLQ
ncbi:MAG: DUF421 domain-containing protein [Paenibacillaceae bacterium]|uniref:DUF421 domain-containing protein n=1 Tax=Paenibacillus mellifer TaxID=2937794 RepID=A0A9X2BNW2_9BACL|nr:DUF421 domain-containing protein [Paenibacillus mellifer]MBW4840699.1 DUF421 domain-containing protein [Paenibacillaceae bacterium]MCK8486498.1 DUF421 domain-containing protein [Paenibacillus mellifer]